MALTFREQIEATAWELGNGEGTTPELRKRFDADSETPNFDPTKALEMLHILQLINYKQAGKGRGRARCHYLKKPEYGLLNLNEPKPPPRNSRAAMMSSTSTTRTARATWSNASCCSA